MIIGKSLSLCKIKRIPRGTFPCFELASYKKRITETLFFEKQHTISYTNFVKSPLIFCEKPLEAKKRLKNSHHNCNDKKYWLTSIFQLLFW